MSVGRFQKMDDLDSEIFTAHCFGVKRRRKPVSFSAVSATMLLNSGASLAKSTSDDTTGRQSR